MVKRLICIFLVMICLLIIPVRALTINDHVEEDTTSDNPELLFEGPISRGQWVHNLVELFELTLNTAEYPDVYYPDIVDSPFFDDIMIATKYGFIDIEAGENFEPEGFLTREDAVHMLNFYLGIQNGRKEYSFKDVENAVYPDDIQVALDRGWVTIINNIFSPEAALTEEEAGVMLAKAQEELDKRNITDEIQEYQFADYVKVIPESAEIISSYDAENEVTTLTISGYDGVLVEDDTVVFFSQGFAFVYGVKHAEEHNESWTVVTKEAPDDAIGNYAFVGQMEPELSPYIPENEPVTLMSADGEAITFGEVQLLSSDKFKISFARDFSSSGDVGYKGKITGTIKDIRLDTKFIGKQKFFTLSGKIEVTSSMEIDFLNDPAAASLFLGGVHLGPFGYAGVEISLKGEASLGYNYATSFKIGLDCSGSDPAFIKELNATQGCISAEGTVSAKLALAAQREFGKVGTAKASIGAGPVLTGKVKQYSEGAPQRCITLAGYLYAGFEASVKFKNLFTGDYSLDLKYSWDFYDEKNSPIRVYSHIEDGTPVYACTRGNDTGGVAEEGYMIPKYYTPVDSQYFATCSSHVNSSGTGSDGKPYVIWTTSENDDGTITITGYKGNGAVLTIPETIDGKTVTSIGNNVFKNNTSLRIVRMADTITSIGDGAFWGCLNLATVDFSSGLIQINQNAFRNCISLTSLDLPEGLQKIGTGKNGYSGGTFRGCSTLSSVYIPSTLTECNAMSSGYNGAIFEECPLLSNITFGDGITQIPANLFVRCSGLCEIIIPETVTIINSSAFSGCSNLKTVEFGKNLTQINQNAFRNCSSLTSLELPEGLSKIGVGKDGYSGGTFRGCSSLTSIYIPSTLTVAMLCLQDIMVLFLKIVHC